MRLFDRFRRSAPAADPSERRQFFRRLSGAGLAVAAAGTLGADEAWATIEGRANQFGITPGTVVDAQGRRLSRPAMGTEPYLGEIMLVGFNFAPVGWALCQGQLLSIAQNTALFSLLGTQFGGNGQTTFGLPDLRGRSAIGQGQGPGLASVVMGQQAGTETTTLGQSQIPQHVHGLSSGTVAVSSAPGTTPDPTGAVLARPASSIPQYVPSPVPAGTAGTLDASTLGGTTTVAGGSQPFDIRDPYLCLNYSIATQGIFPSRP
jgi:microcystin-dependent protein